MRLSRRGLLAGIAAICLWPRPVRASEAEVSDALLALLDDQKDAAALGAAWLQKEPAQRDAILSSLEERLRGQGWAGAAENLRGAMLLSVADDFRTGAVVTVQGWQIARTQAELCAVAYFAETGSW